MAGYSKDKISVDAAFQYAKTLATASAAGAYGKMRQAT